MENKSSKLITKLHGTKHSMATMLEKWRKMNIYASYLWTYSKAWWYNQSLSFAGKAL